MMVSGVNVRLAVPSLERGGGGGGSGRGITARVHAKKGQVFVAVL